MSEAENIQISTLSLDDSDTAQQLVDFYEEKYGEDDQKNRQINSVKAITESCKSGSMFVIAKDGEKLVAAKRITAHETDSEIHLFTSEFYVSEEYQGQGIGSQLDQFGQTLIKQTKKSVFQVCGIMVENEDSQSVHQKWGYMTNEKTHIEPVTQKPFQYWFKPVK